MDQQERRNVLLQKLAELELARDRLAVAENALKIAEMRAGQNCAEVIFGGISITMFRMDRNTSYMPKIAHGRAGLQRELVAALKEIVIRRSSAVEGALRAYTQAAAEAGKLEGT